MSSDCSDNRGFLISLPIIDPGGAPMAKSGALNPDDRVIVFIDGWNLHRACERAFGGHGPIHPLLLGRRLAGPRQLSSVRYFIGVPDSRVEKDNAAFRTRQLEFMAKTGVQVFPKKLRYRHEWKFNKWNLPDPRKHEGETRTTEVTSMRQGREKGVDVELALSAFHAAHDHSADAIIIVSADSDLDLVPQQIALLRNTSGRSGHGQATNVRVENAVVNTAKDKHINHAYDWSHQINAKVFAKVRDDLDYSKPISKRARKDFFAQHPPLR